MRHGFAVINDIRHGAAHCGRRHAITMRNLYLGYAARRHQQIYRQFLPLMQRSLARRKRQAGMKSVTGRIRRRAARKK